MLEVLKEKGFLDIIQSLRLDLAAIEAASRKAEVNLMGETGPAHFGQFTAHIPTLKRPNQIVSFQSAY